MAPVPAWPAPKAAAARARRNPGHALLDFCAIVIRPRTYARGLYLLLSLPLGGLYFAALTVGAFSGAMLLVALIGLVLGVATLVLAYVFCVLDRELVIHLLGVPVPPLGPSVAPSVSPFRRLLAHLRRRNTWTGMLYLCLLAPFGSVVWTVAAVLIVAPLVGLIADLSALATPVSGWRGVLELDLRLLAVLPLAALVLVGFHVLDLMARGWGRFALSMLSTAPEEIRAARAEARAEDAERGRRELILNVSHELRTPIASIQGHLDTLLLPGAVPDDAEAWRPYVQTAAGEAKRLGRLVDELLTLARADADTLRVEVAPVRPQPLVENVVAALSPLARRERGVTILCRPDPEEAWALADPGRLTQVLTNLARNAITHTPPGGAVAVGVRGSGPQQVEVTVADTGVGLRPDELGQVFDRFYRADSARSRDAGGFGLGLAIAKDLVEAMGGSITASSEVGIGTTMRVTLRRCPPLLLAAS